MLETIRQDFIRTARAKGLSERLVLYRHALRNSLIPMITLLADLLPALIGGSIVIETLFSIPGMGFLSYEAVFSRDYPLLMGIFTISALLTLTGILISDFLYTLVDPRIAYEKRAALRIPTSSYKQFPKQPHRNGGICYCHRTVCRCGRRRFHCER